MTEDGTKLVCAPQDITIEYGEKLCDIHNSVIADKRMTEPERMACLHTLVMGFLSHYVDDDPYTMKLLLNSIEMGAVVDNEVLS